MRRRGLGRWSLLAAALVVGAAIPGGAAGAAPISPAPPISPKLPPAKPTIALDRSSGLIQGQLVTVTGTGFPPQGPAVVVECNNTPGQPTMPSGPFSPLPVGCTPGFAGSVFNQSFGYVTGDGALTAFFVVQTGIIGPPALGVDSAGHNSAADAANYPCPPTAAQEQAGATCTIGVFDFSGDSLSLPVSFGAPAVASPAAHAFPSTGLRDGDVVTITAGGFTPLSPYLVVECNLTPGEPTGFYLPNLPEACTQPTSSAVGPPYATIGPPLPPPVTTASGSLSTTFKVREGNVGGSQATSSYPCPPSAANIAAGGSCQLVIMDGAFNRAQNPIELTGPLPVPNIVVFPPGGLVAGERVAVRGAGFTAGVPGGVLECNGAPGQPTIAISGVQAPVGCSNPFNGDLTTPAPDGTVVASFVVRTGVVGPVAPGIDSAGRDAAADAANFPCPPTAAQQRAGVSCVIVAGDLTGESARRTVGFASDGPGGPANPDVALADGLNGGYWTAGRDGGVFTHNGAPFFGSLPGLHVQPAAPTVAMASTPDGLGYWVAGADGGVFSFGDAPFLGSLPGLRVRPVAPIVAIVPTADGVGYWLVGADGGVFSFGDAPFFGSLPAEHLRPLDGAPILAAARTPDGLGYWLAGADGNVYDFGSAAPAEYPGGGGPAVPIPTAKG